MEGGGGRGETLSVLEGGDAEVLEDEADALGGEAHAGDPEDGGGPRQAHQHEQPAPNEGEDLTGPSF